MQQKNTRLIIIPLISLSIFMILIFGAAFAYYAANTSMNISNYQLSLPKQTSLVCTKQDCGVTVTPAQMSTANTDANNAVASNTCYVNCTCSGTQGSVCAYNIFLVEVGSTYVASPSLGANKEFTATITSPANCTAKNSSGTETQVDNMRGKLVSQCTLTVPQGGSVSANVSAEFKYYNPNVNQASQAGKVYKYQLSTGEDVPDSYQKIEYITGGGGSYIDTGYYWQNENVEIYLDALVTSNSSNQSLFGNEEYYDNSNRYFAGIPHGANGNYSIYVGTGSQGNVNPGVNNRFTLQIITTTQKNIKVLLNGNQAFSKTYSGTVITRANAYLTSTTSKNVGHMFLFSNHNSSKGASNGGTQFIGGMQVYAFRLTDNNVIVRDLIPCKRKIDDIIGMYDKVTGEFFTNKGSGSFTAGPNI